MKLNRKKTRKFLYQKLYAQTYGAIDETSFHESFYNDIFNFDIDNVYLNEMTLIILDKQDFFIETIKIYSPKFDIQNMNLAYILPVFIGMAEMFFLTEEIPSKVSVNEAIEMAKVYGDDSAKKIVNGILHKILGDLEELDKIKNDTFSHNFKIVF